MKPRCECPEGFDGGRGMSSDCPVDEHRAEFASAAAPAKAPMLTTWIPRGVKLTMASPALAHLAAYHALLEPALDDCTVQVDGRVMTLIQHTTGPVLLDEFVAFAKLAGTLR